jgi:hypothetical protein
LPLCGNSCWSFAEQNSSSKSALRICAFLQSLALVHEQYAHIITLIVSVIRNSKFRQAAFIFCLNEDILILAIFL